MSNISIKPIKKRDTQNILKWRNSDLVMSHFIDRNPLTKDIHYNWLETKVKTGEVVQFVARDNNNNKDFGSTYLKDIDYKNGKAEFGIFIGEEDYVGKGYGSAITSLTLDYAFNVLKLNKVYARILKYNKPSYYMFKKLGFHKDAILRQDVVINDKYYDVYIVSILEKEWNKNEKRK